MAKSFTFNSISSKDKYIRAIKTERMLIPKQKHEFIDIPQREKGSIMIPDATYSDYVIPVECLLSIPAGKTIFEVGRELAEWFKVSNWGTLTFDDDPTHIVRAVMISSVSVEDIKQREITLQFRVRAQAVET